MNDQRAYVTREGIGRVLESWGKATAAAKQLNTINTGRAFGSRPVYRDRHMEQVPRWILSMSKLIDMHPVELQVLLEQEDGVFTETARGYFKDFVMSAKLSSTGNHLSKVRSEIRKRESDHAAEVAAWEAKHVNKVNEGKRLNEAEIEHRGRVVARWNKLLDSLEKAVETAHNDLRRMTPNDQMAIKVLSERNYVVRSASNGTTVWVKFGELRNLASADISSIAKNLHGKIVKLEEDSQAVVFQATVGA